MKKWLSSGQMIDQLRPGEIAIDNNGFKVAYDSKGVLRLYQSEEKINDRGNKYYISKEDNNCKWFILRNQNVSFDEVVEALNNGKNASLVLKDNREIIFNKFNLLTKVQGLKVSEVSEGKWYIQK
ncbi:hypothetical protein E1I69_23415 [Bacillus timonensis]|uniref:Uncharacterized protein n=1 Tax=Bacillus timonensis TaxID=1033734 RepID=A0A4S3PJD7_9BACI|nr:hypothetical protein [Bacillus timonensis]THE09174.1 hypothetical protein E1I69_23415 [Bacillus timonensis]